MCTLPYAISTSLDAERWIYANRQHAFHLYKNRSSQIVTRRWDDAHFLASSLHTFGITHRGMLWTKHYAPDGDHISIPCVDKVLRGLKVCENKHINPVSLWPVIQRPPFVVEHGHLRTQPATMRKDTNTFTFRVKTSFSRNQTLIIFIYCNILRSYTRTTRNWYFSHHVDPSVAAHAIKMVNTNLVVYTLEIHKMTNNHTTRLYATSYSNRTIIKS